MECNSTVNFGRPDRGPERRCKYKARYTVGQGWSVVVCGYHARAWKPDILFAIAGGKRKG